MPLCCWTEYIFTGFFVIFGLLALFYRKIFVFLFGSSWKFDKNGRRLYTVAFFHPYCSSGGGGERVLWHAVAKLLSDYENLEIYVYTGGKDVSGQQILEKVKERFNITLETYRVEFVHLKLRRLIEASLYPRFTLLGQSIGGFFLGLESAWRFQPNIFIDTTGHAFATPIFRFLLPECLATISYVHYPTISVDMLNMVAQRLENFNNVGLIARSRFLSRFKLVYYRLFAWFYGLVGRTNSLVMVNSSWTFNHIMEIWKKPETVIVFPPCFSEEHKVNNGSHAEEILDKQKKVRILSVGQFRPEKNHQLQLESFKIFLNRLSEEKTPNFGYLKVQLVFLGGCRDSGDEKRVADLKILVKSMHLDENVVWKVNASFDELKHELDEALIGLHAMYNEHFGVGIVECMFHGLITIANNSGGPKMDIVSDKTGFLASTTQEYAEKMLEILRMSPKERQLMRQNAQRQIGQFSDQAFGEKFSNEFEKCLLVKGVELR